MDLIINRRLTGMKTDNLRKQLSEGLIKPGDVLDFPEEEQSWRVLDVNGNRAFLFCFRVKSPVEMAYNESGSNQYEGSDIQKYLHEEFPNTAPEALNDLRSGHYFLLSKEEVMEYMPREIDRIVCDVSGRTYFWLTRSAYRGTANYTWNVAASGYVSNANAGFAHRFAPACGLYIDL